MEQQLELMLEYFGDELTSPQESEESGGHFQNYRRNIVTVIAYLIGVPDEKMAVAERFNQEEYEKIQKSEQARIIRTLCILRSQFLRNYKSIDDARKYNMTSIEMMPEYLDVDGIRYLRRQGIEVNISNAKSPTTNIAYINQYILDNIDRVKPLIPEWVTFEYIKALFLMPGGYAGQRGSNLKNNSKKVFGVILEAGKAYSSQRGMFPYQMYVTWPYRHFREEDGNVLFNDFKFLRMLYAGNNDCFEASRYVVDATEDTKEGVYDFLAEAVNVSIFVDCENVDPYAFAATILNLNEEELGKIKKIVLFDDVNASTAWDYLARVIRIPIEKVEIERVLENKSLVDVTMTARMCKAYYQDGTESIILASSDSDYWGFIGQLPEARFLVLNEYRKTSGAIIAQMDEHGIQHCYMSDFAQDSVQEFKMQVLYFGLQTRLDRFNEMGMMSTLDVDELLQQIFNEARIVGAESQIEREKEAFFNKYLRNGLLIKPVLENGKMIFKIELAKK